SFFLQAEDGIRDFHVTGVQTCALPIYWAICATRSRYRSIDFCRSRASSSWMSAALRADSTLGCTRVVVSRTGMNCLTPGMVSCRSEERRVGKEWREVWQRRLRGADGRG